MVMETFWHWLPWVCAGSSTALVIAGLVWLSRVNLRMWR